MAFCGKCGNNLGDGMNVCPACGTAVANNAAPNANQQYAQPGQQYTQQGQPQQPQQNFDFKTLLDTPEAGQADPKDIEDNKMIALLSYIIFWVPLITSQVKTSPFVKFHANQGLVVWISGIALTIAMSIISVIFVFIPFIGPIISGLIWILSIVPTALIIMGIINVVNGKMKQLPIIGKFTILK